MRSLHGLEALIRRWGYGAKGSLYPQGVDGVEVEVPVGPNDQILVTDDTEDSGWRLADLASASATGQVVGFGGQFGDGKNPVTDADLELELRAPWSGDISRLILDADANCSAVIDVLVNGVSIFTGTSTKPTLSTSDEDDKTDMTDISVTLAAGDQVVLHLDSVSGDPKRLTLTIFVERA